MKRLAWRSFANASLIGGIVALFGFVTLISRFFTSFDRVLFGSDFYDVQATSMLHGHFFVSPNVAQLEGIAVHGKTYFYFGPLLSVLRMPFVVFFPSTSGHLTPLSMTIAFIIFLGAASWLSWLARCLIACDKPVTRWVFYGQTAFVLLVGLGTVAFFLAGNPTVYYETELWGAALALCCLVAFLRFFATRSLQWLLGLSGLTLALAMTRISIAIGMIALLALATALSCLEYWQLRQHKQVSGQENSSPWRVAAGFVSLGTIFVATAGVNLAKFSTLTSIPFSSQQGVTSNFTPISAAYFKLHHDVLALRFLPTTLVTYFSPFSFHISPLFPFFDYTRSIKVVGGVQFPWLQPSSSVTDTMPLFLVLTFLGFLVIFGFAKNASRIPQGNPFLAFRWAFGGALVSCMGTLLFAGVANRYMSDFLPLLILGGAVGFHALGHWLKGSSRLLRRVLVTSLTVLALWSFYANASLGLLEAYVMQTNIRNESGAGYLSFQMAMTKLITFNAPFVFPQRAQPPSKEEFGELYIQNNCQALFSYTFAGWSPVEVGQSGGRFNLSVKMPQHPPLGIEPLLVSGKTPSEYQWWGIHFLPGNKFTLRWSSPIYGEFSPLVYSSPQPYVPGKTISIDLTIGVTGPSGSALAVASVQGVQVIRISGAWSVVAMSEGDQLWTLGHFPDGSETKFEGSLSVKKVTTPLCRELSSKY